MSIYRDIRYKDSLKHQGHELIEHIGRMGTHKITTYAWLARELGWTEERTHFSVPHTIEEYETMVGALKRFQSEILSRRRKKPWTRRQMMLRQRVVIIKSPKPPTVVAVLAKERKKKVKKKNPFPPSSMKMNVGRKGETLPREEYLKAMQDLREARVQYKSHVVESAARPIPQESALRRVLKHIRVIK